MGADPVPAAAATADDKRKRHPRSRKQGTPTHVINQPLRPSPAALAAVDKRLEAGRRAHNACLGEAFSRCQAMRAGPAFDGAKALPKGPPKSKKSAARNKAFRDAAAAHGFNGDALRTYGSSLRQSWVRDHVGAQEAQRLADRAFGAVDRWSKKLGGKPRFKNARRGLRSMECSDRCGDMQPALDNGRLVGVRWSKLVIPVAPIPEHPTSRADREASVERARLEALIASGGLLQTRIVRNIVRGRLTLRAQFVVDGRPPIRHVVGTGTISLDVGPSVVSVVVADQDGNPVPEAIRHHVLAEDIEDRQAELRRLLRHLQRQHEAGSPGCFDTKGRHKKTCVWWEKRSKSAETTICKVAESYRCTAAFRTTSHGTLVNELLAYGTDVRAEAINYAAWQKTYPRSVRDRAAGEFMALLFRKAVHAGGTEYHYSTHTTALSQICVCDHREKKPLSQRRHRCPRCGREAQRDLFSGFLGLSVRPVVNGETSTDLLDLEGAESMWPAFAPHLQEAGGLSGSSSNKHRGQGRRSRRSMARITARRKRGSGVTTEVLDTIPVPDHAIPGESGTVAA